ncbi:MAG: arginine transporter [Yoonia sp.]|uniref:arginine transporter n=1 Tax=Yoonia sp. TaxID=2212373 RepID=UPI003EF2CCC0
MIGLTACSGGNRSAGDTRGATGAISRACLAADRSAATPSLCACVQSVANAELSSNDRNRVARFFADPELANDTKISTRDDDDAFWDRYRAFYTKARSQCG